MILHILLPALDELRRIKNAGGFVEFGRVNGNLALSRAIGDFLFKTNTKIGPKEQAVTGMSLYILFLMHLLHINLNRMFRF